MSMRTLKDLGKIVTGNTPKMSERENFDSADIPFIKPGDISDDSITVINKGQFFISENARDKARILPSDSILVTCIGIIGKVGILTREAAFNQQINGIVPDINSVIPRYLAYAILSQKSYLQEKANAAVVPIINKSQFSELKVEVPNLQKQNEIVRNLDKVDHLISLQKQQLKGLDELVKSRFLERFGDPIINPFGYPIHKLGDYIENLTSGARGWARYYADDGNAWFITIKNVKNCKITVDNMQTINAPDNAEAKRTRVKEGDLLISITADLGRTGVVTKEIANKGSYINQHLSCIRLNRYALEPLYVAYFMESEAGKRQFKKENQSAVKAGINFKSIQSLKLMVPPLVRQEEFLSFYKQVDKSKYREAIFLYLLEDIRICCNI